MNRSQDPKLGEVRAVLQRLQTFSTAPDSAEFSSLTSAESQSKISRLDQSVGRPRTAIALAVAAAVSLLSLMTLIWLAVLPSSQARPPADASADAALKVSVIRPSTALVGAPAAGRLETRVAVEAAQDLLAKGQVQAARKQLMGLALGDDADVAWLLARSYDPNFLATIATPDAGPDVAQATRWYRAWHAAAVTQGLVPNSVSVERIIGSMRR